LAKLADAQHAVAVEYGFAKWSALKAHIEALGQEGPFVGTWHINQSKSRQLPDNPFERATLHFDVVDDIVTITSVAVDASGREERGTNTIRADGREHASAHGYALLARWRGAHLIEAVVKKDGQQVSRVTYDVSQDGRTLTVSAASAAHDGYPAVDRLTVFDRVPYDGDPQVERES
jgi:hypothetical protein